MLEHLEQQLRERRKQYDLLTQRIGRLRDAHAVENDVEERFKQEKHIGLLEIERENLSREMVAFERQIENTDEASDKYKSPKHYLEYQIYKSHQLLLEIEASLPTQNQSTHQISEDPIVPKYRDAIRLYLRAYFWLCSRLNSPPADRIKEIGARFAEPQTIHSNANPVPLAPSEIFTNLRGSRIINVGVSQLFRIADLLTRPESVKAQKFYEALTIKDKARRALNRRASFKLGSLGTLKPVIGTSRKNDQAPPWEQTQTRFWGPARPNFASPTTQPLNFIPYELTLSDQLKSLHSEFESVLESTLITHSESITNSQISGHLRIYPAGIGVISLGITLEFIEAIHVEVVAQIAKNIEELLFVNPEGFKKPYDVLMLDIVDEVTKHLFTSEGFDHYERRWRPPSTTYIFREDHGLAPLDNVSELAYLMSLAPANHEDRQDLKLRVERALKLPHWIKEHMIAIAGEGVGLFFVGKPAGKERARNVLQWLSETHELVSAAAYAQQAFAEEVEKIYDQRLLDESWLEIGSRKLRYLESLLGTMQQVMRATASIRKHLHDQNTGILANYAKDVWVYSNPINRRSLESALKYVSNWLLQNQEKESTATITRLLEIVRNVSEIPPPFPERPRTLGKASGLPYQEELEDRLLDQLMEIERILGKGDLEPGVDNDQHSKIFEQLRLQLGI